MVSPRKLSDTLFCGLWVRTHFGGSCVVIDFGLCPGWGGFPIVAQGLSHSCHRENEISIPAFMSLANIYFTYTFCQ